MSPAPYIPRDEEVAIAYLKLVLGMATVDEDLPRGLTGGFVTVDTVGGIAAQEDGLREAVVRVDSWYSNGQNANPSWSKAHDPLALLEEVTIASGGHGHASMALGADYRSVRVLTSTRLLTRPRKIRADPSGYARWTADLALDWTLDTRSTP